MVCSGCKAPGTGKQRTYQARNARSGLMVTRTAVDPPLDWGIRFVGREKLHFCGQCRSDLALGKKRLQGTVVLGHAEKEAG